MKKYMRVMYDTRLHARGFEYKINEVNEDVKNIYVVITHTHFDHVAGLGVFIWYCNFNLNIIPKIIYSDFKYMHTLKKLLKLTGVNKKFVKFVRDSSFKINDLKLNMQRTTHTPKLQCFGIMFQDNMGKYYYTGDTNDINYIKELCDDKTIKKNIYRNRYRNV